MSYELTIEPKRFEHLDEFDSELADEEWEDEFRRFGRMPGRAPRLRMRGALRRRSPRSQTRPRPRPLKRPLRRPRRRPGVRPRPGIPGGLTIDSRQEPAGAEPREPAGAEPREPAGAEPVEQGSEYVRWVQSSLNQILGLRLPITGVMNAAVRSALRTFQGQRNLPVDGIAGPETRKALVEAKAKLGGRGDEPSGSAPSQEPAASGPEEPSPSGPSAEPPPSGASQEPSQPQEFEWLGPQEFEWGSEGEDEAFDFTRQTGEAGLSGLPASVWKALRAGLESVAIKLAVAAAVREETALTNLIFNVRHPERRGRKLTTSEPRFQELSREWLDIRNRLVRPAIGSAPATKVPSSAPSGAPAGGLDIVAVRGIKVARQIAPKVEALLAAAVADGIPLGGWGYRSYQRQIELRKKHCGPTHYDIYQKPSSQCTPPTATPGKSMHEKGLAIDITYNGKTIQSRNSPAFQWLARNAGRFGLINLPSEPWHWSVNGK